MCHKQKNILYIYIQQSKRYSPFTVHLLHGRVNNPTFFVPLEKCKNEEIFQRVVNDEREQPTTR